MSASRTTAGRVKSPPPDKCGYLRDGLGPGYFICPYISRQTRPRNQDLENVQSVQAARDDRDGSLHVDAGQVPEEEPFHLVAAQSSGRRDRMLPGRTELRPRR